MLGNEQSEALEALQDSFAPVKTFDVKKLKGMRDTFRIRLGDWRLIYEFKKKDSTIIVYEIAPRGSVY
jgi:mRNA interferase RelE/StbE